MQLIVNVRFSWRLFLKCNIIHTERQLNTTSANNTYELKTRQSMAISHFRVILSPFFKTSLGAQPFIWKWVWFSRQWRCKTNSFPYKRLCTKTRFETEGKEHSEMAYSFCNDIKKLPETQHVKLTVSVCNFLADFLFLKNNIVIHAKQQWMQWNTIMNKITDQLKYFRCTG